MRVNERMAQTNGVPAADHIGSTGRKSFRKRHQKASKRFAQSSLPASRSPGYRSAFRSNYVGEH